MKAKKQNKTRNAVIAAAIIAVAVIIFLLLRSCAGAGTEYADTGDGDMPLGVLTPAHGDAISDEGPEQRSADEILADLNRQVAESMITMSMNPDPVFSDGTAKGSLLIHNDGSNHHAVVVQIVRDDTGDVIYTSAPIPIGKYINADTLDVDLSAGEYPCTAYFSYVDDSTGAVLGVGAVRITIHVNS